MKKTLTVLFIISFAALSHAQWIFQSFDNAVGTFFPDPPVLNSNFFTNGPTAEFNLLNDPDHYEGTGSTRINYRVEAFDGWGGFIVRSTYVGATDTLPFIDFSTGTELSLWYKVIDTLNMSQAGTAFIEFKLAEFNDAGRDLWLHHTAINLSNSSGGWVNITMPLVQNDDNTLGFALQFGDGDQVLQFDKVKGFEMAIVYLTAGGPTNTPTAIGSVLIDKLELKGNRYVPLQTFDDAANGYFVVDDMAWAGTGNSGLATLTNNTTDFVEGTGSMQLDYLVNCSQDWGGYINLTDTLAAPIDSFAERTALVLYVKNQTPHTGTADRLTMRFFVTENNTGVNEDWVLEVPINFTQASGWSRYYMPLKSDTIWTDPNNHMHFPANGFAQPWWNPQGDLIFNPEFIQSWKIELSGGGNEYGAQGEQFTGTLLFDVLQQSGFQFSDNIPPIAPENILVVPGTFSNLVTWSDVPDETAEKYFIYASMAPITNLSSPNVDLIGSNILENVQVFEHPIISPLTNQSVTYYYAIVCQDRAGNEGEPGYSPPVTNTAKGVAVVSEVVPAFVADGNLGEWQGIKHFRMNPEDGTGHIHTNTIITDSSDLNAKAWVAIDANYLYVAFDVDDDIFYPVDPGGVLASYLLDSPDLFIGLYDFRGLPHTTYQRGSKPDYHIRFNELLARNDHSSSEYDSLLVEGENYFFGEKLFPVPGYVVEARISLWDLANKRDPGVTGIDTINVQHGFRVPIDFAINDNDNSAGREGLMFYSATNNDLGWNNPSLLSYTWIGDWVLSADDEEMPVNTFSLYQNYPNPFNPVTQIRYSLAEAGDVSIKVFDILGRQVSQLVSENQSAGSYTVHFNAANLSSGVYFYSIESGSYKDSKKMILLK